MALVLAVVTTMLSVPTSVAEPPARSELLPQDAFTPVVPIETSAPTMIPTMIPTMVTIVDPSPTPRATPVPKVTPKPRPRVIVPAGDAQAFALSQVGAVQFACLLPLWNAESHWNPLDRNRSSGAYGIPQAVPGSKMASAGADWKTNPLTQVRWGLSYIHGRYGSPCGAWAFWQGHRWY